MITGTFLDEITHDIPAANWGVEEWRRDFAAMRATGIDTVILIRCGYRDRATFPSRVLAELHAETGAPLLLPGVNDDDLVDLFLTLAEENGMRLFFGTYDSGKYWTAGDYRREAEINRALADEVAARYGGRAAFAGWYISHEIDTFNEGVMEVYERLARHLRALKPVPILISPYFRGPKQFAEAITLEQHAEEWRQVFARIRGLVDIVAFQDGNVEFGDLREFLAINARLAREAGLRCWSNVETFDRDMPIKFPPIAWPKLRYKIEAARAAGVEKLITFEFSHFMSPNSIWPAARHLHARYLEEYAPRSG